MRTWWKRIGVWAGSLLGFCGLLGPAHAQFGGPPTGAGRGIFAAEPQAPCPPEFPNPGVPAKEPVSPFSLPEDGSPNAFSECGGPPAANPYKFALRTEYLNWWFPKVRLPAPLVTTDFAPDLNTDFGAIGQPNTRILLGPGNEAGYNALYGGRVTLGLAPGFIPPMELSGFAFNKNLSLFGAASNANGSPLLARPVALLTQPTLTLAPSQSVYLASFPGIGNGGIGVNSSINLWGTDVDFFMNCLDNGVIQVDAIAGYKYAQLNETLRINSFFNSFVGQNFNGQVVPAGFATNVTDDFAGRNKFNGGTIGFRSRWHFYDRFMIMTDAKLSLGNSREFVNLTGVSQLLGAGGLLPVNGGVLANQGNSGGFTRNDFAVIPELNINLSYQMFTNLRVFVGYNIFYWSSVARAADQINPAIDPRFVPTDKGFVPGLSTTNVPQHTINVTDFFAHGFNVGLEIGF